MGDMWESFKKIPTLAAVLLVGMGFMIAAKKRRERRRMAAPARKAGNKKFAKNWNNA